MRVNTWAGGLALTAVILLTGCSAPAGEAQPDASAAPAATSEPASSCPELEEGTTVSGEILSGCINDAMMSSAGFVEKMSVLDIETTTRYNPAEAALEKNTYFGSMIVIGDQAWVKTSGGWQIADAASADPEISALSRGAAEADPSDPMGLKATLSGNYTVTGTSTRLDRDVFLLASTAEEEGASADIVLEVTSDYALLASTASSTSEGQTTEVVSEITDWDTPQEITAPM